MARILLVEDDPTIREITKLYFEREHEIFLAKDGMEAIKSMNKNELDIIVLDLILPKLRGEVVAQIAEMKKIPVIMVTAKNAEDDILNGLKLGAVDYVTKPFSPKVLLAKVNNFLKHLAKAEKYPFVDRTSRTLFTRSTKVYLSPIEAIMLDEMMKKTSKAFSRKELLNLVWKNQNISVRIVDATIKNLRKKLINTDVEIRTVFGVGYIVEVKNTSKGS